MTLRSSWIPAAPVGSDIISPATKSDENVVLSPLRVVPVDQVTVPPNVVDSDKFISAV